MQLFCLKNQRATRVQWSDHPDYQFARSQQTQKDSFTRLSTNPWSSEGVEDSFDGCLLDDSLLKGSMSLRRGFFSRVFKMESTAESLQVVESNQDNSSTWFLLSVSLMTSGRMLYSLEATLWRYRKRPIQLEILFHGQVKSIDRHLA